MKKILLLLILLIPLVGCEQNNVDNELENFQGETEEINSEIQLKNNTQIIGCDSNEESDSEFCGI